MNSLLDLRNSAPASCVATAFIRVGHQTRYFKGADLLHSLPMALENAVSMHRRERLAKFKPLILDDFGKVAMSEVERSILFDMIDDRAGTLSTIIVGRRPCNDWHSSIDDSAIADAVLYRLSRDRHHIKLRGVSFRRGEASFDDLSQHPFILRCRILTRLGTESWRNRVPKSTRACRKISVRLPLPNHLAPHLRSPDPTCSAWRGRCFDDGLASVWTRIRAADKADRAIYRSWRVQRAKRVMNSGSSSAACGVGAESPVAARNSVSPCAAATKSPQLPL